MAVSSFIPTLWSARLMSALEKSHIATNVVNRDYEGIIANVGDKVKINTLSNIAVKTYTKNTPIADADALTTTADTLEIDQAKYFNFAVDDIDKVQAAGDLIDKAMGNAGYQLADVADKFLLSTIAGGASTTLTETALTAINIYTKIIELRTALDKANVPTQGRSLVVSPEAYALLLQDARFVSGGGSQAEATVRNGLVGQVAGFTVYESNNTPVTDGFKVTTDASVVAGKDYYTLSSGNYTKVASPTTSDIANYYERYDVFNIIATVASATTYAEQIVKTEAYRPDSAFADAVKGLHVYGAKVVDGTRIAVLPATF